MKENKLSTFSDGQIFPLRALLCVLNVICTCLNAQNLDIFYACLAAMCIYWMLIYVRDKMSQERLQQCGAKGASSRKIAKDKILSHIHTLCVCRNQAAGKAEEDEKAEEVAVSSFLPISLSQPRRSSWSFWATFSSSDSMAARLSISGSCRYNEGTASGKKIIRVRSIINTVCTKFLKISGTISFHALLFWL